MLFAGLNITGATGGFVIIVKVQGRYILVKITQHTCKAVLSTPVCKVAKCSYFKNMAETNYSAN